MNFKTLLLGSAAVLLTVSAAGAADKTPAKPAAAIPAPVAPAVDFVKLCSAFGTGYVYINSLDTCIKLQGTVTFNLSFGDNINNIPSATPGALTPGGPPLSPIPGADDDHQFTTAAALTVITTSNTDYGQLTGLFSMTGTVDGYGRTQPAGISTLSTPNYIDRDWTVGAAYVQLGPVLAGYTGSAFDIARGFTLDAGQGSNVTVQQIRLSYALGSLGFLLSAEDYRTRYYAAFNPWANPANSPTGGNINDPPTGKIPDLVAAMTYSLGILSGKFAFGYGNRYFTDSYGFGAGVEVDLSALAKGDRLRGLFEYSGHTGEWVTTGKSYDGSLGGKGNYFVYLASFQHFWTQNGSNGAGALSSAFTASFLDTPSLNSLGAIASTTRDQTELEFSTQYTIVRNLTLNGAVRWRQTEGTLAVTTGQVALQRTWP